MTFFATFLAGGIAGVTVDAILFPLDTIKTRLQARDSLKDAAKPALKNSYRGLMASLLGGFPAAALFWTVFNESKSFYGGFNDVVRNAFSATTAEVIVTSLRCPFEVIKQQMQIGRHSTMLGAFRQIMKHDGIKGLYAGYGITLMREIPFDIIQFCIYEELKKRVIANQHEDLSWDQNGILGAISAVIAAATTTPLDVIKTRMQTEAGSLSSDRYKGVGDVVSRIVKEEGARTLFRGIVPRMMWIGLGGAIYIGSFEEALRRLNSIQLREHVE